MRLSCPADRACCSAWRLVRACGFGHLVRGRSLARALACRVRRRVRGTPRRRPPPVARAAGRADSIEAALA